MLCAVKRDCFASEYYHVDLKHCELLAPNALTFPRILVLAMSEIPIPKL